MKNTSAAITPFAKMLQQGYLEWMNREGVFKSQADFALSLGINPVIFNRHYNAKHTPEDTETIEKYVAHFGPKVYDVLGLARPDEKLKAIRDLYDVIPPDKIDDVIALIEGFLKDIGASPK